MPVVPGTLNYHDVNDQAGLAKNNVIIAGRDSVMNNSFYKPLQAAGHRIVQYIDWVDLWPSGPFDQKVLAGITPLPGGLSNWGGFPIIDYGVSANRDKIVEAMKWVFAQPLLDDVMLDVFGTQLWTSAWDNFTAAQKKAYADGARDVADRLGALRDQVRPGLRMYANGTWNGEGHHALCPAVERHDSEMPKKAGDYWWDYLNSLPWDTSGQPCAIVYTDTLAAAQQWAKVPGVGVVCIHPGGAYEQPSGLALPYATLTPRAGTPTPPPPPTPDPTPTPPPSPAPLARPSAPAAPVVTSPASGSITVDAGSPIPAEKVDSFRVYLNGVDPKKDNPIGTPVTLTGLSPTTLVSVRVSYHNASTDNAGHGPWSNPVSIVPSGPPVPPSPPPDIDPRDAEIAQLTAQVTALQQRIDAAKTALG